MPVAVVQWGLIWRVLTPASQCAVMRAVMDKRSSQTNPQGLHGPRPLLSFLVMISI